VLLQKELEKNIAQQNAKNQAAKLEKQKHEETKKYWFHWFASNIVAILALVIAIIALLKP